MYIVPFASDDDPRPIAPYPAEAAEEMACCGKCGSSTGLTVKQYAESWPEGDCPLCRAHTPVHQRVYEVFGTPSDDEDILDMLARDIALALAEAGMPEYIWAAAWRSWAEGLEQWHQEQEEDYSRDMLISRIVDTYQRIGKQYAEDKHNPAEIAAGVVDDLYCDLAHFVLTGEDEEINKLRGGDPFEFLAEMHWQRHYLNEAVKTAAQVERIKESLKGEF